MSEQETPQRQSQARWKTLSVSLRTDEHDRIVSQAEEMGITLHQLTLRSLRAGLPIITDQRSADV